MRPASNAWCFSGHFGEKWGAAPSSIVDLLGSNHHIQRAEGGVARLPEVDHAYAPWSINMRRPSGRVRAGRRRQGPAVGANDLDAAYRAAKCMGEGGAVASPFLFVGLAT